MSKFSHKYNTDNVHTRAVIVGLVNLLNQKVQYYNVLSDTDTDEVIVPFYYNYGGDERFLQDYFLEWNDCVTPRMADGNYDPIPRGSVTLSGNSINTSTMTNRFVRGTYVKEVNGELITYNAYLNPIPLTMSFEVDVTTDTALDAFKIQQSILETFYKTQVFSVNFRGFRIPCQVGFSEDLGIEKSFEFTYEEEQKVLFKVTLELETYYPVTDPKTERFNGNRMSSGTPNVEFTYDEKFLQPRFTWESPKHAETYFSGAVLPLRWTSTGPILRVNLFARLAGSDDWFPIAKNIPNGGLFNWKVPYFDANGNIGKDAVVSKVVSERGRNAKIRAITDGLGQVYKFIILECGSGYTGNVNNDMIYVELPGTPEIPIRHEFAPNVIEGKIIGGTLPSYASVPPGFPPLPSSIISNLEFKIEDANTTTTYEYLMNGNNIEFLGNISSGINNIILPSINTDLAVGMKVFGQGIQVDTTITQIIGTNITLSSNATQSLVGCEFTASPTTLAIITIE